MITSSNGNIFRVTGHLFGEFTGTKASARSFDVLFDLCLNKRLSKQSLGWWFETPSRLLWRHCNEPFLVKCIGWHLLLMIKLVTLAKWTVDVVSGICGLLIVSKISDFFFMLFHCIFQFIHGNHIADLRIPHRYQYGHTSRTNKMTIDFVRLTLQLWKWLSFPRHNRFQDISKA